MKSEGKFMFYYVLIFWGLYTVAFINTYVRECPCCRSKAKKQNNKFVKFVNIKELEEMDIKEGDEP